MYGLSSIAFFSVGCVIGLMLEARYWRDHARPDRRIALRSKYGVYYVLPEGEYAELELHSLAWKQAKKDWETYEWVQTIKN